MNFRFCLSITFFAFAFLLPLNAQNVTNHSETQITYTQIDFPGAYATDATGINVEGDVVGTYGSGQLYDSHGFLLRKGQFTSIDYPGAVLTTVNGINDGGLIVGTAILDIVLEKGVGFIYDGQNFTTLRYPGVPYTEAQGINNAGDVVGAAGNLYTQVRAYRFSAGRYGLIKPPGHYATTHAFDINDLGDVVGWVYSSSIDASFLLENGGFRFIPFSAGSATGINNSRMIAASTNTGAFVVLPGGTKITIAFPGSTYTEAHRVSNAGQVVGTFDSDVAGQNHGYVTTAIAD